MDLAVSGVEGGLGRVGKVAGQVMAGEGADWVEVGAAELAGVVGQTLVEQGVALVTLG